MPSKLYLNFLQDKVKKRRGGNPINVNRLSKNSDVMPQDLLPLKLAAPSQSYYISYSSFYYS